MLEHGGNINVAFHSRKRRKGMPDSPNSADTLGWAYYQQGVYNASIDLFQEAIKGTRKIRPITTISAWPTRKSNNFAMAKKQLEYTLQISPNYSQAEEIKKILAENGPQKN